VFRPPSHAEGQHAAEQMRTELRRFVADPTNADQSLPYAERQRGAASATAAEFAQLTQFIKTFMNKMATVQNDYSREMAASRLEHILDPKRLEHDSTLLESKRIVQNAKEIVAKYRTNGDILTKNVEKEIANLSLSEENRREFARGLKDGMKESSRLRNDMWECEAQIVSVFEQILADRRDSWTFENGQFVFASERDLSKFKSYQHMLQEVVRKERELQQRCAEAMERFLK
jgi:hypothetical protein